MKVLLKFSWIGPIIFFLAIVIFGFLHPNYAHFSQFISELGADNALNHLLMNYFGIVPFGLSICLFSIAGNFYSEPKIQKLAFIILFLIGSLFVMAGLFNCDTGCAFENMSQKAVTHNMSAFSAFLLSILVQLLIGILVFTKRRTHLTTYSFLTGIIGVIFFLLIIKAGNHSEFRGLYQRLFLSNFLIWLIVSGQLILKTTYNNGYKHNTTMIVLLLVTMLVLAACSTPQKEQVEPASTPVPEKTDVSPTPAPVIAVATAIPPTPIIEVLPPMNVAHSSSDNETIVLPGCFDFDQGISLAPPDPNCDFTLLPGPDSGTIELYPIAPAALAYGGVFPDAPTFAQCAGNDAFSTEPELVAPLAAMFVCYRTGENRVGYLHFTDADLEQAYTVTLEWLTFSHEQNGSSIPEETDLAYQNNAFGFTLSLPETWQGYTVMQNDDEGVTNFCFTFVSSAPTCVLQIDVYRQENWDKLNRLFVI